MATIDGVEDDDRHEDGEDAAVRDGESQHPSRGALLDPVLEDRAVLAHRSHPAPTAATAAHGVATHTHELNLMGGRPFLAFWPRPGAGCSRLGRCQAEPPTAWTPPSTWRISPVVMGNKSEQRDAGAGHRLRVVDVPAERGPLRPGVLEGGEARDRLGRHGPHRPGRHQVDPDALGGPGPGPGTGRATRGRPWPRPSSRRRARPPWRRSRGRPPRPRRPLRRRRAAAGSVSTSALSE